MRLPRYSLLNLLIVITVICLAIPLWQSRRELSSLRREVTDRRAEMGELFVTDESKPHAIGVEWGNSGEWKWRLYLPQKIQYCLREFVGQAPVFDGMNSNQWLNELRSRSSVGGWHSGEHTFRIKFDVENGKWFFWTEGPQWKTHIPESFNNWLADENQWYPVSLISFDSQVIFDPGEPLLLLCIQKRSDSGEGDDGVSGDTIALWIDNCP